MTHRHRGFTLIELLLALTLTSLLTAALSVMIGQAARDRHAMQQQTHAPAWSGALIECVERDLRQARWWSGGEERLVLIGLGAENLPAQIEYRWVNTDSATVWIRKETLLTQGVQRQTSDERIIGIGLQGLQLGPYGFGVVSEEAGIAPSQPSIPNASNAPVLLIDGRQSTMRVLPDRIQISLEFAENQWPGIRREVVLR